MPPWVRAALPLVLVLTAVSPVFPQDAQRRAATETLIAVGADRPVNIGATGLRTVEPFLAANPRNADQLVAGMFLIRKQGDPRQPGREFQSSCAALASFDAGRSWTRHDFAIAECIDPWVAIRLDGSAVFAMLEKLPGARDRALYIFRSADGGVT